MSAESWGRIRDLLAAEGIDARLDERAYADLHYGRVRHGVSRSIFIRTASGSVEINDRWWRKNADKWIGYEVTAVDREGIEVRRWPLTKKRSEVAAFVREAIGLEVSAA